MLFQTSNLVFFTLRHFLITNSSMALHAILIKTLLSQHPKMVLGLPEIELTPLPETSVSSLYLSQFLLYL